MSVNEMELVIEQPKGFTVSSNSRVLGLLAMLCAPMLLLFIKFGNVDSSAAKTFQDQIMSLTGVFYIGGWMLGAIGMRRLRATGIGTGAKILFVLQIVLLGCAFTFSAMEVAGYMRENGGLIFAIADAGYPLSHLLMIVVGIFVWRARVWKGFAKFAPFAVGFALPLTFLTAYLIGWDAAGYVFGLMTTAGLGAIGYTVYRQPHS